MPTETPIQITAAEPTPMPLTQDTPILIQDFLQEQTANDNREETVSPLEIGTAVWCLGITALLGYGFFSTLQLKCQVAASLETEHRVFLCDDIDTPFILGILRPRIYLPSALDEATAAQVLLHERAHLARKDHWWKPLGYLLLTLHWFNPLVWLAYTLLCTDIELACDEKVIKGMDIHHKKAYSEALLTCSVPRRLIAACPLAFGEVGVKQRIGAVLHYKKPGFWVIVIAIAVCIALCFGFLTKPVDMTLESIGDVSAEEIAEIEFLQIQFNEEALTKNRESLFALLAQVELQPEMLIKTPLDEDFHIIVLTRYDDTATYQLCFSSDFTKLQLNRIVHSPYDNDKLYDKHYKVLNPEILQNSELIHSILPTISKYSPTIQTKDLNGYFHLDTSTILDLELHETQSFGVLQAEIITKGSFDHEEVCSLLSELAYSSRPIAQDGLTRFSEKVISVTTADRGIIEFCFNRIFTEVWIRTGADYSAVYEVRNPAGLRGLFQAFYDNGTTPPTETMQHKRIEMMFAETEYSKNGEPVVPLAQLIPYYDTTFAVLTETEETAYLMQYEITENGEYRMLGLTEGISGFQQETTHLNITHGDHTILWGVIPQEKSYNDTDVIVETTERSYVLPVYSAAFVAFLPQDAVITSIRYDGKPVSVHPTLNQNNLPDNSNMQIDPDTGDILSITSYPVYSHMDSSFEGYEALYHAVKTYAPLELQNKNDLILMGTTSLDDREYAIIHHSYDAFLLEYTLSSDGTVSILNHAAGSTGDSLGNYGYAMNCANFDKTLYWTSFGDKRWATTTDGTETHTSQTVPTDYTGFRFIWADLQQKDYPADDSFFLAEVDSAIPPAIAIPMVGSKVLTALGWRLP